MKFSIDDYANLEGSNDTWIVVATKANNPQNLLLENGFDYLIQKVADSNGKVKDTILKNVMTNQLSR